MASNGLRGFVHERVEGVADSTRDVGSFANGLLALGRGGRDILVGLVRAEIDRALPRLGLATTAETDALRRDVDALSARVGMLEAPAARPSSPPRRRTSPGRASARPTGAAGGGSRMGRRPASPPAPASTEPSPQEPDGS